VATDAHGTRTRRPDLKRARRIVEKEIGPDTADVLFLLNPKKALNGEDIDMDAAGEAEEPGKGRLWLFLKKMGLSGRPGPS